MAKILALGGRDFMRLMQLGGAQAGHADAESLPAALEAALVAPDVGVIMVEESLVGRLPAELARRAFLSVRPKVVAQSPAGNEALRRRVRQVIGADLLAPKA